MANKAKHICKGNERIRIENAEREIGVFCATHSTANTGNN